MFRDPWSWAYTLIALAALALTSVATYIFFGYLLAWPLALAATVVLAAGIPVLKWAVRFETRPGRARVLWVALGAFLGIELLAQYFKGQAAFAPAVAAAGVGGSDLARAARDPLWSRVLATVFLASLPLVVVLMVDRLADRAVALSIARPARGMRRYARFRRRAARLRSALRANLRQLATTRDELATTRETLTAARVAVEAASQAEIGQLRAQLGHAHDERDRARALAVQLRAEADTLRGRPQLTIESALTLLVEAGAPEATIRGWRESGRLQLASAAMSKGE